MLRVSACVHWPAHHIELVLLNHIGGAFEECVGKRQPLLRFGGAGADAVQRGNAVPLATRRTGQRQRRG